MDEHYGAWDRRREPLPEEREPREPKEIVIGPPIEREHETLAGIFEEDERRERERG